jgi:hypothetical protein
MARTRMAMGTAMFAMFLDLAHNGFITGGGPADPELRDAWYRTGWKPYTARIPGTTLEGQYRGLDPLAMSMQIAADLNEIVFNTNYADRGYDDVDELLAAGALSISSMILSKSYVSGAAELFDSLSNPNAGLIGSLERQTASAVVPFSSLMRKLRAAGVGPIDGDPYLRYTAGWLDEVKNLTPGLSATLPLERDLWGRPINPSSAPGALYDFWVPVHISDRSKAEPIDLEIIDRGFTGIAERSPTIGFGSGSEPINLRAAERMEVWSRVQERAGDLQLVRGRTLLELMNSVVTPPADGGDASLHRQYARMTDGPGGGKEEFLRGFVSLYYQAAREQIARELIEANDPLVRDSRRRAWNRRAPADRQPEFAQ